jgi:hypothetical protein
MFGMVVATTTLAPGARPSGRAAMPIVGSIAVHERLDS